MLAADEIDVHALQHTANTVIGAMSDDPDQGVRDAYTALASQDLSEADVARVVEATLGAVLGLLREILPEGPRQHLVSRLQAVRSYASLVETMNTISAPDGGKK